MAKVGPFIVLEYV